MSQTLVVKFHDLFLINEIRVRNPKTTINNNIRALKQILVLDPVN